MFGWAGSLDARPNDARAFYATIAVATLLGAALSLVGLDPVRALYWRHTKSYNAFSEAAGMSALDLKAAIIRSSGNVAEVPITDVWLFRASEPDCELLPLN